MNAMTDTAIYNWLMDNADLPIRYRTARELLGDTTTAKALENKLLDNPVVQLWLARLNPQPPPRHLWPEHGSFDDCLENAMLKLVQLGLHGGMPQINNAVEDAIETLLLPHMPHQYLNVFNTVLVSSVLSLAGIDHTAVRRLMLDRLNKLHHFAQFGSADIYLCAEERAKLTGVPKCWKEKQHFIRPEMIQTFDYGYPLIYDIVGLHSLYRLNDATVNQSIDTVIRFVSTDVFHQSVADQYGILITENRTYLAMGWDPKCPGWFDVAAYLHNRHASQLLFYAQHAARYPAFRKTVWFCTLLKHLETYRTETGRYLFPAGWLREQQGYAVMGQHLSFGENRRYKRWREIESTFYMQLLKQNIP